MGVLCIVLEDRQHRQCGVSHVQYPLPVWGSHASSSLSLPNPEPRVAGDVSALRGCWRRRVRSWMPLCRSVPRRRTRWCPPHDGQGCERDSNVSRTRPPLPGGGGGGSLCESRARCHGATGIWGGSVVGSARGKGRAPMALSAPCCTAALRHAMCV